MGNMKKVKCQSGVKVLQGKKGNTAILCSSLCSLRGTEQGNMENVLAEKRWATGFVQWGKLIFKEILKDTAFCTYITEKVPCKRSEMVQ